jgi:hypothetical protein
MTHLWTISPSLISTLGSILAVLLAAAVAGVFVRGANARPTITLLQQTVDAYKEAVLVEERQKVTLTAQVVTLEQQVEALKASLTKEEERSAHLEQILADQVIERRQMQEAIKAVQTELRVYKKAHP